MMNHYNQAYIGPEDEDENDNDNDNDTADDGGYDDSTADEQENSPGSDR